MHCRSALQPRNCIPALREALKSDYVGDARAEHCVGERLLANGCLNTASAASGVV